MKKLIPVLFVGVNVMFANTTFAQENIATTTGEVVETQNVLQIATIAREPFVIENKEGLTGFSIELFNIIANRNGWEHEFVPQERFTQLLSSVREPVVADAAIANISITSEREKVMDFSSPIFDGGLQIMVPNYGSSDRLWKTIFETEVLTLFGVLLVLFCAIGFGLYSVRKRFGNESNTLQNNYMHLLLFGHDGKQLQENTKTRLLYMGWIIVVLASVVYITFVVTQKYEQSKYALEITSYSDLQGQVVGVSAGSTAENYLRKNSISTVSYDSLDKMFADVSAGRIDALVHDAPVVQHYATYSGRGTVIVVGGVFNKEQYGIALPTGSDLKDQINDTLLIMKENGTYDNLYDKWFNK